MSPRIAAAALTLALALALAGTAAMGQSPPTDGLRRPAAGSPEGADKAARTPADGLRPGRPAPAPAPPPSPIRGPDPALTPQVLLNPVVPRTPGWTGPFTAPGGGAQCRTACAADRYLCQTRDGGDCGLIWSQCVVACPATSGAAP